MLGAELENIALEEHYRDNDLGDHLVSVGGMDCLSIECLDCDSGRGGLHCILLIESVLVCNLGLKMFF